MQEPRDSLSEQTEPDETCYESQIDPDSGSILSDETLPESTTETTETIGKDSESLADSLLTATEESAALDEDPVGDVITGVIGTAALIAGLPSLLETHHVIMENPSSQFGI